MPLPRLLADACTITLPLQPCRHMHASLSLAMSSAVEARNALRVVVVPAVADALTVTI